MRVFKKFKSHEIIISLSILLVLGCNKKESVSSGKLNVSFDFTIKGQGSLPDTVVFINNTTNANRYEWNFDDASSSTLVNPTKIYTVAKTYSVKLVAYGNGVKDSLTKTITISLDKPKPDFNFSILSNGGFPASVSFNSISLRADSVKWDFDDGKSSTSLNFINSFKLPKTYNVKLIAYNSSGKDSIIKPVQILFNKPTANFSFQISNSGQIPTKVIFNNTSQNVESYQWIFGDGNQSLLQNPENTYSQSVSYNVKLIVSNPAGQDSLIKQVIIPPANLSVRVFLITPIDRSFNKNYYDVLKTTALNIQTYYKNQLGGRTFTLNNPVIDTLTGLHSYSWYNSDNGSNISGTDPRFYGYYNTLYEISKLVSINTNLYTYIFYVAAPGGGAGSTGQAALGDQDLDGLLSEINNPVKRWIGGSAHEWGHAFGLPHPANQLPTALMWTGYTIYPNCILQQTDKDLLNSNKFFK